MSPWPCLWVLGERGIPEESRRIWGAEELRILLLVLQLSPGSRCPSASPCPAPRSSRGCSPPPSEWQFGNLWGFPLTGKRRHGAVPARGALFCFSLEFSGVWETLGLLKTLGIEPGGGRSGRVVAVGRVCCAFPNSGLLLSVFVVILAEIPCSILPFVPLPLPVKRFYAKTGKKPQSSS